MKKNSIVAVALTLGVALLCGQALPALACNGKHPKPPVPTTPAPDAPDSSS